MEEEKKKGGMWGFLLSHATFIRYCIVGAMATALETGLYMLFYSVFEIPNVISTFTSWLITMLFAFCTNKFFVYRAGEGKSVFKELMGFFSCRIGTGIFNLLWMLITVDILSWMPLLMKILSAFMVGIINYVVGKVMIFKRKA